ncbi:MAG: hypothetical protein QNJ12_06425 [Ilumatobacter sp.]|uniref:hypothetical protein n=1 Tax=Ilumatobacter sp. TaxID=1967498 RepID=UPI00262FCD38|nr:hypothetical protein [Ilumatobacter sp.]MDJ0768409.1 hypothetical protein [Ilumatobacter sp.]
MTDQLPAPTLESTLMVDDAGTPGDVLAEAVAVIDAALAKMMQRELVSTGEVADLLLDLRTLLSDAD